MLCTHSEKYYTASAPATVNTMRFLSALLATLLVVIFCISTTSASNAARYDDFKVYRVYVTDAQQISDFKKLSNYMPVHYLNEIGGPGRNYSIVIDPANQARLESQLQYNELEFKCIVDDLQEVLEESKYKQTNIGQPMEWTRYHSLYDIYHWLDNIASVNKKIIKSYTIGYSYEGRPIKAVKISAKKGNKAIFIDSNIHAIEWISSATSTCFIDNLLKSNEMKDLLKNYDWIFVPILNPDGFEYSHNVERLWRKNRKPTGFSNSSGICYGTDLNRNFDYNWGGDSWNIDVPCDHWYGGAEPNSEPEIIALQKFVNSFSKKYIRMYLTLHSFGNLVLLPYGHTDEEFPTNYDQMMRIATSFADAAKDRYGTNFRSGASSVVLYKVSGSEKDWAYGVKGIPFSTTIELRDEGKYGFFLPASQIEEVCEEVTDGLIAMIETATLEGLFK